MNNPRYSQDWLHSFHKVAIDWLIMDKYQPKYDSDGGLSRYQQMSNPEFSARMEADTKTISNLMKGQILWWVFAYYVWHLDFFWVEGLTAGGGAAFYLLLAILLTSLAIGPSALAIPVMVKRGKKVTSEWEQQTYGLIFALPISLIWAALWLWCFPHLWTLLPWGDFESNLWKFGPYIGLFIIGMMPSLAVGANLLLCLANPKIDFVVETKRELFSSGHTTNRAADEAASKIQGSLQDMLGLDPDR